ncbi:GNAT family N-acetyltransferase [Paractinoplanes lichenicola]|uniref:GNAT family N-acetyltransferase n=1 Tax=Paractinoplanes lichenicola TaxID=2802976 RepID=UPI0027DDA48F|nr:GNAT family N-acetyltransferase [Actinoplanes lichenicola]
MSKHAEILSAACAVVAARGADATRFSDVTAATGVGVSTLQYFFGSRDDMLRAVFRHSAQRDFDEVAERLTVVTDPWQRLLLIASHLTGAVGSDVSWRVWVESWRWALRDPDLRVEVLADYTRWRELLAAEISGSRPIGTAQQILALIDGLALPAVLGDPTMDSAALLEEGLRKLTGQRLRPARDDDALAVARIWESGWRDGHLGHVPDALVEARTSETFRTRAAQRIADTTVAVAGDEVAGFVMVAGDEVEQVYVDAAFRGGGVARALLAEAERQVAAGGHPVAWLAVVPGNARARHFYEREGWTDAGGFDYLAAGVVVPCRRYTKPVQL